MNYPMQIETFRDGTRHLIYIPRKPGYDNFAKKFIAALLWVGKARSKDDGRPVLKNYMVQPGRIAASDGFRIHIMEWDVLDEGKSPFIGADFPTGVYNIYITPQIMVLIKEYEKEKAIDIDKLLITVNSAGFKYSGESESKIAAVSNYLPAFLRDIASAPTTKDLTSMVFRMAGKEPSYIELPKYGEIQMRAILMPVQKCLKEDYYYTIS